MEIHKKRHSYHSEADFSDNGSSSSWRRSSSPCLTGHFTSISGTQSAVCDLLLLHRDICLARPLTVAEKALPETQQPTAKMRLPGRITHTLTNGQFEGVLSIPDSLHYRFLLKAAQDAAQNVPLFINEIKSHRYFRFFVDLDFYHCQPLTDLEVTSLARIIQQEVVASFLPDESSSPALMMGILTRPPRTLHPDKELASQVPGYPPARVKNGIHLVFPYLVVEAPQCLWIRQLILFTMLQHFSHRPYAQNSWEKVVDEEIYMHNGLRMPYSYKMEHCPNPECRENQKCDLCGGLRKVVDDNAYTLKSVLDSQGEEDPSVFSKPELIVQLTMKLFTIRLPQKEAEPTPKFVNPAQVQMCPPNPKLLKRCEDIANSLLEPFVPSTPLYGMPRSTGGNTSSSSSRNPRSRRGNGLGPHDLQIKISIPLTCLRVTLLTKFIRQMHPRYAKVEITRLGCNEAGSFYVAYVRNSNFCQRMGRDHKQSPIYFHFSLKGLVQRCTAWHTEMPSLEGSECLAIHEGAKRVDYCRGFASKPFHSSLFTIIDHLIFFGMNTTQGSKKRLSQEVGIAKWKRFVEEFLQGQVTGPSDPNTLTPKVHFSQLSSQWNRPLAKAWTPEEYESLSELLSSSESENFPSPDSQDLLITPHHFPPAKRLRREGSLSGEPGALGPVRQGILTPPPSAALSVIPLVPLAPIQTPKEGFSFFEEDTSDSYSSINDV